jgi:hypothetical protein
VEVRGYKNIMNLPDFQNSGKFFSKQKLKEVSVRKFLPASRFFTGIICHASSRFFKKESFR